MTVAMPTFATGHEPSEAEFGALLPLFARKTADETVTSSTTLQNDDALVVSGMDTAGVYRVRAFVLFNATNATNGGFKTTFTLPTGATATNWKFDWLTGTKGLVTAGAVSGITCTTSVDLIVFEGLLVMGGTAGNLQFQWAQNSSSANGTVVKAGSWLWAQRLV